jgi:arylsulfatase A-like enzyme
MDAHDPYYVERGCGGGRGYRDAVRCLDRQLASIVEWQSTRRSTVLALLSDHGELFGEHGLERHGNALFVQQLHVPMMIRHATSLEPPIDPEPISIAALPALLGVRGADAGPRGPIVALLHPPAAQNTPSEWSAIGTSWHLIVRERGLDALYHLPSDPAEEQNLIAKPPADPEIDPLRAAIAQMRRSPRPDAGRFRSLGYIH